MTTLELLTATTSGSGVGVTGTFFALTDDFIASRIVWIEACSIVELLRSTCLMSQAERSMPFRWPSLMYSPTLILSSAVTTGTII